MNWAYVALPGALFWTVILLLPWRPWSTRERLEGAPAVTGKFDLSEITVLIPARNEARTIKQTLQGLDAQGNGLSVILVDDQSSDGTPEAAAGILKSGFRMISGQPLPAGWTGKLWALEQGRAHIKTPLTLLMDADIELRPGILATLRDKMRREHIHFISLMAALRMETFWEKLLLPAFVYFFKLLYPFRVCNNPAFPKFAAAGGGCILLETKILEEIGGFNAIRNELIDDCALARKVKSRGYKTWLGLTHSALSNRTYHSLGAVWNMVTRSAFTQLHYSLPMLILMTGTFIFCFWVPVAGLVFPSTTARLLSIGTICVMLLSYIPILGFYRISRLWALAMPAIGTLYLAMTWASALGYWRGKRSHWKDRVYPKKLDSETG